jgi:hypothetical protein
MDVRGVALPERRGWRATRSALYLRTGRHYDDWVHVGRDVTTVADSAAWWLGDWLMFGRESYCQRYQAAVASTEFDYQTLRNYAWVASRFSMSRRRDMLSFGHHAELAAPRRGVRKPGSIAARPSAGRGASCAGVAVSPVRMDLPRAGRPPSRSPFQ